jgi:predicted transposase YdaD
VPGPFDTTLRHLIQAYPDDWISFLGLAEPGKVDVIDANVSTVTAEVDKVMGVGGATPWLVHLEFQSSYDPTMGQRLVRYNAMLHVQHQLPVETVLVLLRASADGLSLSGEYRVVIPGRSPYLTFTYNVRRIWQEPATELLAGALGTLPLAPLGDVTPDALPRLLRVMDDRYAHEATVAEAAHLRVVTYTLLGLRYPPAIADQLMPGIRNMRDSATYMAIVEEGLVRGRAEGRVEGRVEEARELLVELGTRRFGPPNARTSAALAAIGDHERLHALVARLFDAAGWDDLLTGAS